MKVTLVLSSLLTDLCPVSVPQWDQEGREKIRQTETRVIENCLLITFETIRCDKEKMGILNLLTFCLLVWPTVFYRPFVVLLKHCRHAKA